MVRRLIATVALVGCAGIYALAANERATFILTNGDRKTGTLVHHGGNDTNLIDSNFNLGTPDGKEQSYPKSQVAVIDFAGGQPSANELQSIPPSGHFLVLRNGQSQNGQFVNIAHGDTLIWKNASGEQQQYAVSDVTRVYLNPQSARVAFNAPASTSVGTAGSSAVPLNPGEIRVDANQAWTDAGITVKKGDRVAFRAQGQIHFGEGPTQTAGPDGNAELKNPAYPVAVMPVGGLIAKVGNSAPFPVGSNTQPIVMPADGRLMLGVNDDQFGDNSGYFIVAVNKQR
jgi:PA-IL-like protein